MEDIRTTLGTLCNDLRGMDLCEALSNEEFAESTDNAFLNLENGTFINVTQGNRTVVQIDVQCTAQFFCWKLSTGIPRCSLQ